MSTTPELRQLPLSQIRPDPTQSRSSFDSAELRELADSIEQDGLVNPITVRQVENGYEIIAGERRFRAHELLKKEEIACFVYPESTPALATEYLSLVENIQRIDLNPIEEAKGYFRLTRPPYDQNNRQIAHRVGKGEPVISRALALLELPDEIQESLSRGKLTERHARVLAKITNLERQIELARKTASEEWSVKQLEEAVGATGNVSTGTVAKPGIRQILDSYHAKQDAEKEMLAKQDPLRDLWVNMQADDHLKNFQWRVEFIEDKWIFEVSRKKDPEPAVPLAAWFERMTYWIKSIAGLTPIPNTPSAPSIVKVLTASDSELKRLVESGPYELYVRLYGKDSPMTTQVLGLTWKDLNIDNPLEAVRDLLAEQKKTH